MQRGVITNVEAEIGIVRAPGFTDNAWLVTFDTELESAADRAANLNCRQAGGGNGQPGTDAGDPQARVIYGTRRLPFHPMVYIGELSAAVEAADNYITFTSTKEFPVSVGDSVYIGHEPTDSEQIHLVTHVDFVTGAVTINAHGVAGIAHHGVVIGMVKDSVYDLLHLEDTLNLAITASAIAISGGVNLHTQIAPAVLTSQMNRLTSTLTNSKSAAHMRVSADSTWGLRDLSEQEANAPEISNFDPHSGQLDIEASVLRAGGNGTENNIIATDFLPHIGASSRFQLNQNLAHTLNNANACPSNYFQVDMPEETGIYAEPQCIYERTL